MHTCIYKNYSYRHKSVTSHTVVDNRVAVFRRHLLHARGSVLKSSEMFS